MITAPDDGHVRLVESSRWALAPVDGKTLDHFVVAGGQLTSFAERGLLCAARALPGTGAGPAGRSR